MGNLYVMAGCPGSGKSTFIKNNLKENDIVISRDNIRFSMVNEYERYFAKEDEVLEEFWLQINTALAQGKNVYADQTSLTPNSRKWLLSHVKGYDNVYLIWVKEDLETCLKRNNKRKGTRAYVPESSLKKMFFRFVLPSKKEGFDKIYVYTSPKEKEN